MSEVSQETINRALLGDPDAAKECTDAGCALPCPECGGEAFLRESSKGNQTFSCDECGPYDAVGYLLGVWNARPDLTAAARELYAPKWIPHAERTPPPNVLFVGTGMSYSSIIDEPIRRYGVCNMLDEINPPLVKCQYLHGMTMEKPDINFSLDYWMPLPKPPEVKS